MSETRMRIERGVTCVTHITRVLRPDDAEHAGDADKWIATVQREWDAAWAAAYAAEAAGPGDAPGQWVPRARTLLPVACEVRAPPPPPPLPAPPVCVTSVRASTARASRSTGRGQRSGRSRGEVCAQRAVQDRAGGILPGPRLPAPARRCSAATENASPRAADSARCPFEPSLSCCSD